MITANEIAMAIKKANFVWIAGNGGSASTANHLANDLVKICNVKAISLCANEAVLTAYANDDGYDRVFVEQLIVFLEDGDLVITISGSGTSNNILKAIKLVEDCGDKVNVISFPTMKDLDMDMQRTEDYHLKLVHEITDALK